MELLRASESTTASRTAALRAPRSYGSRNASQPAAKSLIVQPRLRPRMISPNPATSAAIALQRAHAPPFGVFLPRYRSAGAARSPRRPHHLAQRAPRLPRELYPEALQYRCQRPEARALSLRKKPFRSLQIVTP